MSTVNIERPSDFEAILRNKVACMAMPIEDKKRIQILILKSFKIGFELGLNGVVEVEL